ncbi:ATP-binding protein [Halopenitus persicus]|uniref:histidine kinase n=1 Tax=Halopenitus persicus TaxID=1048396 RepID=A0A1H3JJ14_9EURY|nr:PAS domain-containing sensor histidine kinase [Halopenitus persicus]SDY39906.1 PAS domain S-box-containing protein [Halopenitus persicus]
MTHILPTAFERLEHIVVLFAEDGTPKECNPATERLLGYSQEQFLRSSLADLIAPRAEIDEAQVSDYINSAAGGENQTFEWQIKRANGEPRWVQVTLSPISLNDGQYVLGEFQDLTAYKARGRRLQLLYRVLRHNLRNDMNVIQGRADQLQRAVEDEDIERQAEIIKETAIEIGELSDSVADLERLVEKDASERHRTNAVKIIRTVAAKVEDEYPEVTIELSIKEETYISVDEGFRLALEHAIANAIEHNDADDPHITISQDIAGHDVVIRIADNGPGIPEMEIDALENGATPLQHGSGLGLSIIQWCTRSLGGNIDIATHEDTGSTVSIQLPKID